MENDYFLNAGVSPAAHFEPAMHSWNSFTLAQELSCSSEQTSSCSLNPNWDKQFDHFTPFDSPLSTMVPSPVATGPPPPPEYNGYAGKTNFNGSCFSTPLNSPAKPQCGQILNQFGKEIYPNMTNSFALNPILPDLSVDPGFVERAAKFSCFGSRSFNDRKTDLGSSNKTQFPQRSNPSVTGINKLQRVWSTPTLKQDGFQIENKKLTKLKSTCPNSNEGSSISEQVISGETVSKTPNEVNSRKRKAVHRAKPKEEIEASGSESGGFGSEKEVKNGEMTADDEPNKEEKANLKPSEPTKDYIHVRARRGQATDSHSLAERVRREKIGERMKLLQDLVPGCNKVTGKALMLDEIINYVKSLQGKVEFLSMKLASVNPRPESNMDNYNSKDEMQQNSSFPNSLYPIDPSVPVFHGHHQSKVRPPVHSSAGSQCLMDSVEMDTTSYQNLQVQLPPLNGFTEGLPQFHGYCEDDLDSIIQMGFSQNLERGTRSHSSSIPDDASFFSRRYEL